MARGDYQPCWIRAGQPEVLHSLGPWPPVDGLRRALCGAESYGWRCTDDLDAAAEPCPGCADAAAVRTARLIGRVRRRRTRDTHSR